MDGQGCSADFASVAAVITSLRLNITLMPILLEFFSAVPG